MSQPLDDYLSRVARELRSLPLSARENELREVRSHLEQLIEDGVGTGQSREAATSNALVTFGDSRIVARELRDVWEGATFSWKQLFRALFCGFVFLMSVMFAVIEFSLMTPEPHSAWLHTTRDVLLPITLILFVPFSIGMIFAVYLKRRAWMPNLVFFSFLLPCTIVLPGIETSSWRGFWIDYSWLLFIVVPTTITGFLGTIAGNAAFRRRRNSKWALTRSDES